MSAMVGRLEKKWAHDDNQQSSIQLRNIEQRLAAHEAMVRASLEPLEAKIEQTALLAERVVRASNIIPCLSRALAALLVQMGVASSK